MESSANKRWLTKYVNHIGKDEYPIYLIVLGDDKYDLYCEREIWAMAWYDIYEESVAEYKLEQQQE
jgi:hypothetical protein